jgi:hypothetical protein
VSYSIHSQIADRRVVATVILPAGKAAETKVRFRVPGELPLKSVEIDGRPWSKFDAQGETVTLPAVSGHEFNIVASF